MSICEIMAEIKEKIYYFHGISEVKQRSFIQIQIAYMTIDQTDWRYIFIMFCLAKALNQFEQIRSDLGLILAKNIQAHTFG